MDAATKECCRLIRLARSRWNAHENKAARQERTRALQIYQTLDETQKDQIPQELRQWLRYRSEFYLGRPKKKRKNAPNPVAAQKPRKKPTPSPPITPSLSAEKGDQPPAEEVESG